MSVSQKLRFVLQPGQEWGAAAPGAVLTPHCGLGCHQNPSGMALPPFHLLNSTTASHWPSQLAKGVWEISLVGFHSWPQRRV